MLVRPKESLMFVLSLSMQKRIIQLELGIYLSQLLMYTNQKDGIGMQINLGLDGSRNKNLINLVWPYLCTFKQLSIYI